MTIPRSMSFKSEKYVGQADLLVLGQSSEAATGLFSFLGAHEHTVRAQMARGLVAVEEHGSRRHGE